MGRWRITSYMSNDGYLSVLPIGGDLSWNARELGDYIRSRPISVYLEQINSIRPDRQYTIESQVNNNVDQPELPRNNTLRH